MIVVLFFSFHLYGDDAKLPDILIAQLFFAPPPPPRREVVLDVEISRERDIL